MTSALHTFCTIVTHSISIKFTRLNLSDQLGWINQTDCVVEFNFCLHVSTVLKESVHFKMAQTEVIRVGLVMISEVLSENLHELFKKKKIWRKRRWWVKNWVTQRNSLGASLTVLKEWQTEDGEMCGNHLRMSDEQFTYLLASVTPFIKKQDTVLRKKYLTSCKAANYAEILSCRRLFWYIRGHVSCTQMHNIQIPTWRVECYTRSTWRFYKGKKYIRNICVIY